jgi:hypothetical protein
MEGFLDISTLLCEREGTDGGKSGLEISQEGFS